MTVECLIQERTSEAIRASLERSFTCSGLDAPQMREDWNEIGKLLLNEFFNNSVDDFSFFKRRCDSINLALSEIKKFESNYSNFILDKERFSFIETTKNILVYERNLAASFVVLYKSLCKSKSPEESLKSHVDWYFLLVHYNMEKLPEKKFPIEYLPILVNRIRNFSSSETVKIIFQEYSFKIDDSHLLDSALREIKICTEDLNNFCDAIEENIEHENMQAWLGSIPETDDHWLDSCPDAKASVERGLAQASLGKVRRRSFVNMEFSD